ncbi:MAG TPA: triose-phosphate isomerase [Labilithrix sp.]|nr:triose-phosphate isomerase [Labilithrix sp.]
MNPSRRPLIAGNWKMFNGGRAGVDLAEACVAFARDLRNVDVVIAPPYTALAAVADTIDGSPVQLAAQDLHPKDHGAHTGDISGPMLEECGCTWVIVGHSERRQNHAESDALVAEKTAAALKHDLLPIVCVGETLQQRESGETLRVVKQQVDAFLDVIAQTTKAVAIAYEPVWAIGTGKTAGPAEAEEVHAAIRQWLEKKSPDLAKRTRILYGGSVKADNAAALFACPNVDGALVGGASLDAGSFGAIAKAARGN